MLRRNQYTSPPTQGGEGPSAQIFQLEPEERSFVVIKSRAKRSLPPELLEAILDLQAARLLDSAAATEGDV